jgi:hypothetical protein
MSDGNEFSIHVDGERFVVRRSQSEAGGFDYEWVTGPHPGYGFSTGSPLAYSRGEPSTADLSGLGMGDEPFVEQARTFLAMIDPATGFVAD